MNNRLIPYARQSIGADEIKAVVDVLSSDWITSGPRVDKFESRLASFTGAKYGIAVNSGTAALHSIMTAIEIVPGDEVIIPAMTFAATASCVIYQGGTPIFADVHADTLLIDPADVERKISRKTKAIIAVDYAGHPADYGQLRDITNQNGLILAADAAHSIGGCYAGTMVGAIADLTAFSFHPAKNMTTGEGGMITTDNETFDQKIRAFRNHGIQTTARERQKTASYSYDISELGYNYRITDIQCAIGICQLKKLPDWIIRRQNIARMYCEAFEDSDYIRPLKTNPNVSHAFHLFVVRIAFKRLATDRSEFIKELRSNGIVANVHYLPVHLHTLYRKRYGTVENQCPVAESAYEEIISLPMFPGLSNEEIDYITNTVIQLTKP